MLTLDKGENMSAKKEYKLDLTRVLSNIDIGNLKFYETLSTEEQKSYIPLVLMRYMSSLTDQNPNSIYAVLATNDLVNLGFWQLTKHPELQHMLLCLAGVGSKQYHSWISVKNSKNNNKLYDWVIQNYPHFNHDEVKIWLSQFDDKTFKNFLIYSGISDSEVKETYALWKKYNV